MATTKVTVTLPNEELAQIRELVDTGRAASVSGFVTKAVRNLLEDEAVWVEMLESGLAESGGPMTDEERAWVDDVLAGGTSQSGSSETAA